MSHQPRKPPREKPNAPDTARVYERARPESESGMGRLDNNDDATPTDHPDRIADGAKNKQPLRQINAEEEPKPAPNPENSGLTTEAQRTQRKQ
jgi:hypothetical protein